MNRPRILVTQPVHDDVAAHIAALGTLDVNPGPQPLTLDELAQRLAGAAAMRRRTC
jgi:phosphonate dehydrogenase